MGPQAGFRNSLQGRQGQNAGAAPEVSLLTDEGRGDNHSLRIPVRRPKRDACRIWGAGQPQVGWGRGGCGWRWGWGWAVEHRRNRPPDRLLGSGDTRLVCLPSCQSTITAAPPPTPPPARRTRRSPTNRSQLLPSPSPCPPSTTTIPPHPYHLHPSIQLAPPPYQRSPAYSLLEMSVTRAPVSMPLGVRV